jgi:hypothetical protein
MMHLRRNPSESEPVFAMAKINLPTFFSNMEKKLLNSDVDASIPERQEIVLQRLHE